MNGRFTLRILLVLAVFVLCFWRVIGLTRRAWDGGQAEPCRTTSRSGLDLKGGTHLILQSASAGFALKSEADQTIDRTQGRGWLRADISYTVHLRRNDPAAPSRTRIRHRDPIGRHPHRPRQRRPRAILEEGGAQLARGLFDRRQFLCPHAAPFSELLRLKAETLQQSMSTIENRINGLGLDRAGDPAARPRRGRARDLGAAARRQRPGASDESAANVGSAGDHERVIGGPYGSVPRRPATQNNGILPANSELAHYARTAGATSGILLRAQPHRDRPRPARRHCRERPPRIPAAWQVAFSLSRQSGQRFGIFTAAEHRAESGGCARQSHSKRGLDRVAHRVRGRHQQHRSRKPRHST